MRVLSPECLRRVPRRLSPGARRAPCAPTASLLAAPGRRASSVSCPSAMLMAAFNRKSAGRPSGTGSLRLSLTTARPVFLRRHPGAPSRRRGERNITSSSVRTFMKGRVPHSAEVWRSVGRFPARKGGRGRAVAGEPGGEFHRQSSCSARPLPPPFLCAALAEAATSAGRRWVSLSGPRKGGYEPPLPDVRLRRR